MVSTSDISRNRRNDRLLRIARQSQTDDHRRVRAVRNLRRLYARAAVWIRSSIGRMCRHHRRRGRPDSYIHDIEAKPESTWRGSGIGLFVYGPHSSDPASSHASFHDSERTYDQDEARTRGKPERKDNLPGSRSSAYMFCGPFGYPAARHALFRKPFA